MMQDVCGGTSCQQISTALAAGMNDDTVSQIILDVDSPGGSVFGIEELAAEIRSASARKPIVAIANSLAASAAYWLACSAGEFFMAPGAMVGSIGAIAAHEDISKALDAQGVKVTLVTAAKYKAEGHPYGPLPAEAQDFMQSQLDTYYSSFVHAVARGRGTTVDVVRGGMGQGRCLLANDAVREKMVDGVLTMKQVIQRMRSTAASGSPKPTQAAIARSSNQTPALNRARNELALLGM